MVMSGPLLTGYTQTINDYYDRELDAINEPYRPIPSGFKLQPLYTDLRSANMMRSACKHLERLVHQA